MQILEVESSDMLKIFDALAKANSYFVKRDEMNAAIHLADTARYSPITSTVESAKERLGHILVDNNVDMKEVGW